MAEMTRRERILAASGKRRADRLPFFHNWRHCQTGWAERECRNRGMGISWARPSYVAKMHGVEMTETQGVSSGQQVIRRTYSTPLGSVTLEEKRETGVEQWHGLRSWNDVTPWQTERAIKGPDDYKVLQYMYENLEFTADYFPLEQAKEWLGEDGIVMDWVLHSPMQLLMIDWVGSEGGRFFIHHARYPDLVEEAYRTISKSYEPLWEIAARSPADVFLLVDNIDAVLVNPRLFQKYFIPEWNRCAEVMHKHGKLVAAHCDGRMAAIKDLIPQTSVDIIEALHSPPMGDLPIGEALSLWKDKVIWTGFPGSVYTMGAGATKKHALKLLREAGSGERLAVEMSTENLVSDENLLVLTSVLEKAELPLTAEKVDEIERLLA